MEIEKQFKDCDFCNTKNATCLCFKCYNYFCDNCFKIIHDLKKDKEHKKENLDIFVPIELKCQKHFPNLNNLFCLDEKEICCAMCHFKNLHFGHNLVEISNKEDLKTENLSIENEMNNFNDITKKMQDLKNKIENEIENINNMFDKSMIDLKNSYQKKYDILLKEENDLKENLQYNVTKIKEKLEINLSEINNNIKINERINKGFNKALKENQSMLQILSYISKINISKKNMKKLETLLMKSIKFNYEEKNSKINYEEIYFNGITQPKNIEVKTINSTGLNIKWSIDDINLINIDKAQIKFKVEFRKKDDNIFREIYQGKETNCIINNLSHDYFYDIRICSFYKELIGEWIQIRYEKPKPKLDSLIIKDNEFFEQICKWCNCQKFELLFRGTRDGMTSTEFHKKCDNKGPTLSIIKNEKGHIFGGYASISWTCEGYNKNAPQSFLFTLTNIYNTKPTKFPSKNEGNEVYHGKEYGPIFGKNAEDFCIYQDFIKQPAYCDFPKSFKDILGKGKAIITSDENSFGFNIKEIEVYQLLK